MKKTKIICTVGPATESKEMIKQLMENGMDVARINMSHAGHEQARRITNTIRELNKELGKNVGILIDTHGPDLGLQTYNNENVKVEAGDIIVLTTNEMLDNDNKFVVNYPGLNNDVKKGDTILLAGGSIELVIADEVFDDIICEVVSGGIIKNNCSVNVPNVRIGLDFLSERDRNDIALAVELDADYIALSFIRDADDVLDVIDILISLKNEHMQIISKIENRSSVDDLENIIKVSDGIMVARGDLCLETSFEETPYLQKKIIKETLKSNKICIVATQMLATMQNSAKPTRAEISDIANAVVDGVDAVMLSEETAVGSYPIATLDVMRKTIINMEDNLDYDIFAPFNENVNLDDVTSVIADSVVKSSKKLNSAAIITSTVSGNTAKKISSSRPSSPIIAITPSEATARSLSLYFGITSIVTRFYDNTDDIIKYSLKHASEIMPFKNTTVIITGSFPYQDSHTNFMKIEKIEE